MQGWCGPGGTRNSRPCALGGSFRSEAPRFRLRNHRFSGFTFLIVKITPSRLLHSICKPETRDQTPECPDTLYGFNALRLPCSQPRRNRFFRVWPPPSPLSVLARNPIKFGHFQPFLCGFFECIPESRNPTVPHLACAAPDSCAPRRENYLCNRTIWRLCGRRAQHAQERRHRALPSCPGRRKGHVCGRRHRASHVRARGWHLSHSDRTRLTFF